MAIKNNKKGILFTFIAILLITVLMMFLNPQTELSFNKDIPVVKTRVTKINNFVTDFENVYLPSIMRSTTYRALTALTYYMNVENSFLANLQPAFKEVLFNGTINKNPIDIMDDNTLINWTNTIKASAEETLNVNLNFNLTYVNIFQTTPWFIDIWLILSYSVSSEIATWTRNDILIKTKLSVDNLYDPLYYVNTDGAYKKKINQIDIKFDGWNVDNLSLFIGEEGYFHWQDSNAPNFLMRFTSDFSSSPCCGIESAVDPSNPSIGDKVEIYLDYLYFNPSSNPVCTELYSITGLDSAFSDFKLDWSNVGKYLVVDNAQAVCTQ